MVIDLPAIRRNAADVFIDDFTVVVSLEVLMSDSGLGGSGGGDCCELLLLFIVFGINCGGLGLIMSTKIIEQNKNKIIK